ncbi:isocitrate lyase/PEP mutase family protein [Amphiplicatus metriothermophilus]|uniref:2-Methylisocitrate lyase, PEP mutase family n=1 Tax=Amphiplicatus metriothermophilus TaxID=1519374 RepID=A0A239PZA2_9PROT|nr:isocitrate lyase/phosphoenolpyruvate mutase family protein [Amphiplicatus metriothermophilus]MBB5518320.1 2-methylisocitrate lyase-like PEP mutase family enzyme [Amphiplicatus metriothermophilus]SNT75575.1 2-Methylisocitrate lyase, PEP mutase family [Amphiplicatus metriothermophilus]
MPTTAEKVETFRTLHKKDAPFIMPNPWDAGSARVLESLGFRALATTSSGFALTLGRNDYRVARAEALAHARAVAAAVDVPVSADLENGFGLAPEDAAETIRLAGETGLAGGSIEDSSGDPEAPVIERARAVERVAAAVEAARAAPHGFVLTARAEGFLHGQDDLDEIIARLQAFEAAGADVLYAPGLPDIEAVRTVCAAVSKPVNVLAIGKLAGASLAELAEAGAARVSIGGLAAWFAYGAMAQAAAAMLREGRFEPLLPPAEGAKAVRAALA